MENIQATPSRFLHVANGTSTTRLIEAAGIPGALSIWADPLVEGPVPAGLTDAELLDLRTRHLGGVYGSHDPVNDMAQWRAAIERHHDDDEVVLWFEHDLFDQLNLIQLLSWIRERLPSTKPVSLVCIGSFPGRPAFKGLGELTPGLLAPLMDTRQPVTDVQFMLAERAWLAFRQPSPEALDDLRQGETTALPFLASVLTRFLQEFPSTIDGLSRTERRLMQLAAEGGVTLLQAFPRMHDDEDAYYVADLSMVHLAEQLSQTSPALLTLTPGKETGARVLRRLVTITETGRNVLAARQDKINTCVIDRWLGGVHLQSGGPIWRWDDARLRITLT
ncbi:MAG: hypothetical protein ABIS06_02155 [Vicinamibacterales bacterium]